MGLMNPTRWYFFRARCMREMLMVVFPQFCPVAAMNIRFAKVTLLICPVMALTLCHNLTRSDKKCK